MTRLETRNATLGELRVAASAAKGTGAMSGRAIRYNSLSEDLGGFRELFAPGSVQLSDDLLILFSHDSSRVLGRTSAGTAKAYDDGLGIVFEVQAPDTTWARDLAVSMRRGDVKQCSFSFQVIDDGYHYDDQLQTVIRTVYAAQVSELSIVAMPAYPATEAAVV